jgi:L-asparaginase II
MQGNRFLTGLMRFVTGHATGMTGAEGVDVAVLMFFVF